ncbi:radical SAM/SPASM domain-containing protein [Pantoea sp. A4]|uniref:radical SAM/SPASM domain-containing protein n=1 Tax=Pantoea sp. A4 TaxID=1225184 RepID=UPI00037C354D|nr:radical SAM/SPASM domain-containing protein [Pantoea sp. A4]
MKLPLILNPLYRILAQNTPETIKPTLRGWYNLLNKIVTYGFFNRDIFTAIDFEINSHCNLECSYCPTSFEGGRGTKYMDELMFRKVIDDLATINYSGRVSPHFFGEPLLDERLPRLMAYAREKLPKCQIIIHTNGIRLSKKTYDECMAAGVTGFLVTQHTPKMPRNVQRLVEEKYAKHGTLKVRTLDNLTLFNRSGSVEPKKSRKLKRCFYISDEISVTHLGNVLCTNDFHETTSFGNVKEKSIIEIWRSKEFRKMRKDVMKGKFELEMCKSCIS